MLWAGLTGPPSRRSRILNAVGKVEIRMAEKPNQQIPEIPLRVFAEAQAIRARKFGREVTPFDKAVSGAVIRAAELAMNDVRRDAATSFRVVTAPTGSGKSVSAASVATVLYHIDPTFSCAFVVGTVRQVDEMGLLLSEFLGKGLVTVWSTNQVRSGLELWEEVLTNLIDKRGNSSITSTMPMIPIA